MQKNACDREFFEYRGIFMNLQMSQRLFSQAPMKPPLLVLVALGDQQDANMITFTDGRCSVCK